MSLICYQYYLYSWLLKAGLIWIWDLAYNTTCDVIGTTKALGNLFYRKAHYSTCYGCQSSFSVDVYRLSPAPQRKAFPSYPPSIQ